MNIYITNLDQTVTKETLNDLFKQHGEVKTTEVVLDAFTGKPRGFAFALQRFPRKTSIFHDAA